MTEGPEPLADPNAKREYQKTLALFAIVAAAIVIWFQRHIEPFVTETLIIGGTISAWGVWQLAWSFWKDQGGTDDKDLTRRLLARPRARRTLWFFAMIAILLHACTASVYLRPGGAAPGESSFKVQVTEKRDGKDEVFAGPFTLTPGDVVGHPIFPSFRTHELTYQIVEPRGFLPVTETLHPWSASDLEVPGSFARKKLHIVVFAPDAALFSELPKLEESGGERYYLDVMTGGAHALLKDFSRQLAVTGASLVDLPIDTSVKHDDRVREELADHFNHAGIDNPAASVSALLDADVARFDSADFPAGAPLVIEVGTWQTQDGKTVRAREFTCNLLVPEDGALHTLVVGPTLEGKCK